MSQVFIIFLILVCALLFFVHFAVYKGLISIFAFSSGLALTSLKIFLIVFGLSFVVANILAFKYNNLFTRIFYTISTSWYGILFYLLLAVVFYAVLVLVLNNFLPSVPILFGKIFLVLAILTGIYGFWNAENTIIKNYEVNLPNLPKSWENKKIVWISDVHLGLVHRDNFFEKIVEKIKQENPDIIFIGGDLYDGLKIDKTAVISSFQDLKPPLGSYFVTGNHEEFDDATDFIKAVKSVGVKVLNNEAVNIDGVQIVGISDRDSKNRQVFENILTKLNLNKTAPIVLLKHQPSELDVAEKSGVNLQISGHTHRAQMWPLSYVTKIIFKGFDYGQKNYGNMQVVVSDGVGTWGPPLRVGTHSEILVLSFKSN